MSWLARLANVLRGSRVDRAVDDEITFHIEARIDELLAAGMTLEAARDLAQRQFGNRLHVRESSREIKLLPGLADLLRDVRLGLRSLRRTPVFTSIVLLTLALGIGASTAILSIVNGVLLRPLAYPHPAQLMYFDTAPQLPVSVPEYLEFQRFNQSFVEVGAFRLGGANLMAGDRALRVRSATVDAHLLKALGVQPAEGRLFVDEDSVVDTTAVPVALLSYDLWQSAFGARPMIGQRVDVDGRRVLVVGVTARGADLMDNHTEIWLPLGFAEDERLARNNHNLALIGRLREGTTAASAQAELDALLESWSARAGIAAADGDAGHVFVPLAKSSDGHVLRMTPLAEHVLGRAGRSIWVLQAAVGLVLLIACANVANLLLARAATRQREFAVLAALGAGRGRLLRKVLTESLVLSIGGGAVGMVLARLFVLALVRAYPASLPRIGEAAIDLRVVLVSLALSLSCALLFGLAPLMHARADAIAEVLRSGPRGSSGATRRGVRGSLVAAEIALALIVVVGAGLLLRTVHNLTSIDAGFDRSRLLTFSITLPPASFELMDRARAYQRLLDRLRAVPGVEASSAMTSLPLDREFLANQTEITGGPAAAGTVPIDYQRVMSGYFDTMGIPILQGRGFQPADAALEGGIAVVNEALANTHWKGRNPLGQRLRPAGTEPWFTVVGVAKDVKQGAVDQQVGAEAYLLVDQLATDSPTTWVAFSPTTMHVVVRSKLPLEALSPTITQVVHDVAPAVPVARLREMDDVFLDSIQRPRLLARLLSLFAGVALLLAAMGTYGVLAALVAEHRREMAVRLALGASPMQLCRHVIAEGLRLAGAGVALGVAGVLALNRFLVSLLFGVRPVDVTTLAIVIPSIVGMAVLAAALPAWRASRLDPNEVLRTD